ncbi:MAG: tail fiber domain-containing protein [bacterium]
MRRALGLMILLVAVAYSAPVENVISFQGKIIVDGTPFSGTRSIEFNIYDVESGGTALWTENHIAVEIVGGLFNVELGGTTPLTTLDFDEQYWVGISIGIGAEITPRYKLTSSPYAMSDNDWVIDGDNMYSGVTGNVGIGTITPNAPLHIFSGDHALQIDGLSSISTTTFAGLGFQYDRFTGEGAIKASYPSGQGYLTFLTTTGGVMSEKMRLNYDGNLGIGTTFPTQLLHVDGNARVTGAYYDSGNSPGVAGQVLSSTGSGTDWIAASGGADNDWAYSSGSGLTGDIYHTGYVGIGTTSHDYPLHVTHTVASHSVSASPTIWAEVTDGTYTMKGVLAGQNGFQGVYGSTEIPAGRGVHGEATGGDCYGVYATGEGPGITNYGAYCRGIEATGSNYGVRGYASGGTGAYGVYGTGIGASINYGVYCSGSGGYTGTWTDVSDRKFKKNIAPMTGILAKVLDLNPVTYEMRTEEYDFMGFSEGTEYGLIAQELMLVFPELVVHGVHPGDDNNAPVEYEGVDYISLTSILVRAVQEQQAQIEGLETENAELRVKNAKLEHQNADIIRRIEALEAK